MEEWLPLFLSLWETEEARVQGDLGPWAEHASPWVGLCCGMEGRESGWGGRGLRSVPGGGELLAANRVEEANNLHF